MKPTVSRKCLFATTTMLAMGIGSAQADQLTRMTGAPVGDNQNSLTAGPNGPVLLQDHHLIEKLAAFDRERIPERVVHARGTGAEGVFRATEDLSDITRAVPFQAEGQETPVFVRFSTVIHPSGSPESLRDPRGFAVKFYTEEGNWDLVGNNLPVFFIRDAIKFPDMIHSLKPDPVTNLQDPNRFFDFFSHIPESTHMFTQLYSSLGIPTSYRKMDGAGVHAFKFTTEECNWQYVKFTWRAQQGDPMFDDRSLLGVSGYQMDEAADVQRTDFNNLTRDLYTAIDEGNYPVWDLYIQTLDPSELNDFDFNPLDNTKIWPEELIPSRKVGELTLNKVPDNFFQSTEQAALAPSNMIPGIEPSEDRMLQGRLFSYADTQRYRLGINHMYLPVNAALSDVNTHAQDGAGFSPPRSGSVNYQPSRSAEGYTDNADHDFCRYDLDGTTQQEAIEKTHNFAQAGDFYRNLSEEEQDGLIEALHADLGQVEDEAVRTIMTSFFYKADSDYGTRLAEAVNVDLADVQELAESYED
ncbi:catalase [Billgrantia endophytica]|nr:catalase [Halomonas endophytica]